MKNYNWFMAPETLGNWGYWKTLTNDHKKDFLYRYIRWSNPMVSPKDALRFAEFNIAYYNYEIPDNLEYEILRFWKSFTQTDEFLDWIKKWRPVNSNAG